MLPRVHQWRRFVRRLLCVGGLCGALLFSGSALAFGLDAHRVVGLIAEDQICPSTRTEVRLLMGRLELARAGVWADQIRSQPQWSHASPWHYINVPDGVPVRKARRNPRGDVLSAIERFHAELQDAELPEEQRQNALRFLVHFVADVHQPLHVGRRSDLGGNKVAVKAGNQTTNLHRYWDGQVLRHVLRDPRRYALRLLEDLTQEDAQAWRAGDAWDWAQESMDLRPEVYAFAAPATAGEPAVLDPQYQRRAQQITDRRLLQAGVRVAAKLDAVFCTP